MLPASFPGDEERLARATVAARFKEIVAKGRLKPGIKGLEEIHQSLFEGLVPWAGQINQDRKVAAARASAQLERADGALGREAMIRNLAVFLAEVERYDIFKSGNRHATFAAASIVAKRNGYAISWSSARMDELNRDVRQDAKRRTQDLETMLLRITRRREQAVEVHVGEKAADRDAGAKVAERRLYDLGVRAPERVRVADVQEGEIIHVSKHHVFQRIGDGNGYCAHDRTTLLLTARLGERALVHYRGGQANIEATREPAREPVAAGMRR